MKTTAVVLLLTSTLVPLILPFFLHDRKTERITVLSYPLVFTVFGAVGTVFETALLILVFVKESIELVFLPLLAAWGVLMVGTVWLFFHSMNWRLEIGEDQLIYRDIFRRVHKIPYGDVIMIREQYPRRSQVTDKLYIYTKRRTITVEYVVYNFRDSLKLMKKYMKKNGCACEITRKETRI